MAHLIYITNASLDSYIEDKDGKFNWTDPNEDLFVFITNLIRDAGIYLYGRRLYESMMVWETDPNLAADSPMSRDFAETWQAANKIVYSGTLQAASTRKTHIERNFDPDAVRRLKATAEQDILIGGAELAAQAFRSELIDEYQLFLHPVIVGGGKPALPGDVRINLELLEERSFSNGTVFLRYRTTQRRAS